MVSLYQATRQTLRPGSTKAEERVPERFRFQENPYPLTNFNRLRLGRTCRRHLIPHGTVCR